MISRDTLRQLAEIESKSGHAVSFFYQPPVARDKSHREEQILIKDLVREASESQEKRGRKNGEHGLRTDLGRIASVGNQLRGNGAHSKAIFACSEQGIWREFNLPAQLPERAEIRSGPVLLIGLCDEDRTGVRWEPEVTIGRYHLDGLSVHQLEQRWPYAPAHLLVDRRARCSDIGERRRRGQRRVSLWP